MFRTDLLLIIRRFNSVETAIGIVMRYVDWLIANSELMISSKPVRNM